MKKWASLLLGIVMASECIVFKPITVSAVVTYTGIDVSSFQKTINWDAVDGTVSFAIIRCATTNTTDAKYMEDSCFKVNYQNVSKTKLPIGTYFYTSANSKNEMKSNIEDMLKTISGCEFQLPVFLDLEQATRQSSLGKEKLTEIALYGLKMIKDAGYTAGVYANKDWFTNYLDKNKIKEAGYEIWYARYPYKKQECDPYEFDESSNGAIWQYTESGRASGISTKVDLDIAYKDYGILKSVNEYSPGLVSGEYYLKNNSTGTYAWMNGKDENTTDISLGEKKNTDNFKMKITPVKSFNSQYGSYISPFGTETRVVNAYSDNPSDGTNVNIWAKTEDVSQYWIFEQTNDSYVIRNKYYPKLVMTAVNGTVKLKTYSSGNRSQLWTLEKITEATLSSITLSSAPSKKEYYVGDKIDTSGMKVTAKYDDGTTKDVTSAVKVNTSFTETGEKEVEVSYTEENVTKTAKFTVTVKEVTIPFKGKGTADDPYQIGSADDLVKLRETINDTSLNSKFAYAYYKQTADIDLKKQEWIPIGIGIKEGTSSNDYNRMFHGVYDGGNHYIHNLNVTGDFLAAGLFGFTDGKSKENQGVVRNLVVDGTVNVPGSVNSGGIVGQMMSGSVVENCGFIGDVTGGAYEGSTFNAAGGITGCLYEAGTIKNCYHTGNVTSKNCAAGIAGMIRFYKENSGLKANIENCYQANGKITSDSESGAITAKEMDMGTDNKSSVVNCFADSVCGANIKADKVDINTGMLVETSKIKKIAEDLGDAFANGTEKLNNGYPVLKWETNSSNSTLDLNADGELNATDALVLQRYLLGSAESGLKDTSAADMNKNGRIDIADLCMIKAELIK